WQVCSGCGSLLSRGGVISIRAILVAGTAVLAVVVAQCASAADVTGRPIAKEPFVPPISPWAGLYTSFSAGRPALPGDVNESNLAPFTNITNNFSATTGALATTNLNTGLNNNSNPPSFNSASGRDTGAVFTFTMGYNLVWNRWLVGVQSEVSENLSETG